MRVNFNPNCVIANWGFPRMMSFTSWEYLFPVTSFRSWWFPSFQSWKIFFPIRSFRSHRCWVLGLENSFLPKSEVWGAEFLSSWGWKNLFLNQKFGIILPFKLLGPRQRCQNIAHLGSMMLWGLVLLWLWCQWHQMVMGAGAVLGVVESTTICRRIRAGSLYPPWAWNSVCHGSNAKHSDYCMWMLESWWCR